jgi:vacuolar-type H+-ATPase subunit C/Vma6
VDECRALALREPLSLAPVLLYVLRLRAEHRALVRVLWQLALGVPADVRLRDLEVAA